MVVVFVVVHSETHRWGGGYYRICGRQLMLEIGSREKENLLNICIYIHVRDQEVIVKWWE